MQRFLIVFSTLMLVSPADQVLAGSDTPMPASGATKNRSAQGNGADKAGKRLDKAVPYGAVSGLEIGGGTKSGSSLSVDPGTAVDGYGRSVLPSRHRLPDPRSER